MTSPPTRALPGVPVFPLPDYHLFPGSVTPLHIFETRYRQMMHDLMDGPGRLVVAPYDPAGPRGPLGPVLPHVGTLVEILQTEELEDGRWMILLLSLARVHVSEVASERLYRKVDAQVLAEPEVDGEAAAVPRERLLAALQARANGDWNDMPDDTPIGRLADVLLHALELDPERRALAYFERDPLERSLLALEWHDEAAREGRAREAGEG